MLLNEYFESISFAQGAQFNVSHTIDTDYMNKLHWHPFVEIIGQPGRRQRRQRQFLPV